MFSRKQLKLILLGLLVITPAFSHSDNHKCTHDQTEKPEPHIEDPVIHEGRNLGSIPTTFTGFNNTSSGSTTSTNPSSSGSTSSTGSTTNTGSSTDTTSSTGSSIGSTGSSTGSTTNTGSTTDTTSSTDDSAESTSSTGSTTGSTSSTDSSTGSTSGSTSSSTGSTSSSSSTSTSAYTYGTDSNGKAYVTSLNSNPNALTVTAWFGSQGSDTVFNEYVQNKLIPPILNYFAAAFQVKYPLGNPWSVSLGTVCGGIASPNILRSGIKAQLFWVINDGLDTGSNWVADSYACNLRSGNKRPYIGKTTINRDQLQATTSVLYHERNMVTIMHEFVHILGFSMSLYQYYVDANGARLPTSIGSRQSFAGDDTFVLNVEPLTTKLRNFYGCSTLVGAYMENTGSSGTAGSHFERRVFGHEIMTSGSIFGMAISQFTFALLEGSGWYTPNYAYAEPFNYGMGQGCDFITGTCSSSKFSEFCDGSVRGCTAAGNIGGECAGDIRSDGCRFQHPRISYHCENEDAAGSATLPNIQTFGRGKNSKCFEGTLAASKAVSQTSYCFTTSCSGSGSSTKLTINVGSTPVVCTAAGAKSVTGYAGTITCPDPIEFCSTVGKLTCPRNCMGRGTCVDGKCVCKTGFSGSDCALGVNGL